MKEIGQFFKERFEQFEPSPPADFWSKIQNDKALKRFNKLQSFKRIFKFGLPPAAVVVVAILFWVSNNQKENSQNQIDVNTLKTSTTASQLIPNSELQQENKPKTNTDILSQDSKSKNKNVDNQIDNKKENNTETISNSEQSTTSPISNTPTAITNKRSVSQSKNNLIISNKPEVDSKAVLNRSSNVITTSESNENNTPVIEESLPEYVNDKNNNTNPEEEIDKLLIPNSFTPNGDGINDQFLVKAIWNPEEFELIIYERSGNIVFKTNEIGIGWDGTCLGKEIHAGVYVYLIIYTDSTGNKQKTQGTLNLIR